MPTPFWAKVIAHTARRAVQCSSATVVLLQCCVALAGEVQQRQGWDPFCMGCTVQKFRFFANVLCILDSRFKICRWRPGCYTAPASAIFADNRRPPFLQLTWLDPRDRLFALTPHTSLFFWLSCGSNYLGSRRFGVAMAFSRDNVNGLTDCVK